MPAVLVWQWAGLNVNKIEFEGVAFSPNDPLPSQLEQQPGQPLDPEKVRASLRRLFETGRYRTIEVRGLRTGDQVTLIYAGPPRVYVGQVVVKGPKNDLLRSVLERSARLEAGTPFYQNKLDASTLLVEQSLAESGYYQPTVTATTQPDYPHDQMNVTYIVQTGPQARIGTVTIKGADPGLTMAEFRKKGKLKPKSKVSRDTVSHALSKLRAVYQKKDRLEASLVLESQHYNPASKMVDYTFDANQGPVVKVVTEGLHISKGKLKRLVPVYEEGAVDIDLLNEGAHNLRDSLQKSGYFDAVVTVHMIHPDANHDTVVYDVHRGPKHRVDSVSLHGNKYFGDSTLRERLSVQKANIFLRTGSYSQSLTEADVASLTNLYHANGFDHVKITPVVHDTDEAPGGFFAKEAHLDVTYNIVEGPQQKFGQVNLNGVDPSRLAPVKALLNTTSGQPYSLTTLAGDQQAIEAYYLSNGFEKVNVTLAQHVAAGNPNLTDVSLDVAEGSQVFVKQVLISGRKFTKPDIVDHQVSLKAGDPLDQSALLTTQRHLYNLGLFNEVNAAVQNPAGDLLRKNVLLQLTEAKRWNVTYGFGFQAQTGTPTTNCIALGNGSFKCNPNGKVGASPLVSLDVTRINLGGRDQTLNLRTAYGTLEKRATLEFDDPRFFNSTHFGLVIAGGYTEAQDLTTFASTREEASVRLAEKWSRINTLIYTFTYRRVQVNQNSLQVSANLIPILSEPVRVGGPDITYIRDNRTPSPLDATHGSYLTVEEFFAHSAFGSQTDFNKLDVSQSSYYSIGKKGYVLARNTRVGFEIPFGNYNSQIDTNPICLTAAGNDNAACNPIPLPERLYAGGATSLRGFPINAAGPRDLQTGYPVGGNAVFINQTELRFPPTLLPYVGDNVSFVLFHDMGNVFNKASEMFPSAVRIQQPHRDTCKIITGTEGTCNFNDFTHTIGLGLRYKTPVGPLRADFAFDLNAPIYPVIYDYGSVPIPGPNGTTVPSIPPYVGQANHFNFFFSIGQSF